MAVENAQIWLNQRRWAVATLAATLVLAWTFLGGSDGFWAQRGMSIEIDRLQQEIALLQAQNTELQIQILRLQDDLAYLERIAREHYGMARPGERVYRVIPTDRTERGISR